ncbi:hypothetical protein GGTG_06823 [Gaeumannomyces tritici R3-111a-1]|uniref:Aminoglycoside phosphotransferase domain-containing protein n=1 Tax=Gaeumannomyces tritici (strain R3-111a-1) TaxID=644352 RepID=J3NZX6_GAET3|nr:hypothetical protein GGTG_06823 [Gaeumannomyces tritici R3-111a-1]EJT76909.1 hypothetical protein GGTG_06823 [Gaeumannomyces tritici R3-111a-1]
MLTIAPSRPRPGANAGVGFASARKAQKTVEQLKATGQLKGTVSALQLDQTDPDSVERAAKAVEEQFGRLDVLVNNGAVAYIKNEAGNLAMGAKMIDAFKLVLETNVVSLFTVSERLGLAAVTTQDYIITQWTRVQAGLATLAHPKIGSIFSISEAGDPVIGRLANAVTEGLANPGPFSSEAELGIFIFADIVRNTELFRSADASSSSAQFPLNHMDLGTQNILVDEEFNFLAVIDWEFAQIAPWQVNHNPFPFPLFGSERTSERPSRTRDKLHPRTWQDKQPLEPCFRGRGNRTQATDSAKCYMREMDVKLRRME